LIRQTTRSRRDPVAHASPAVAVVLVILASGPVVHGQMAELRLDRTAAACFGEAVAVAGGLVAVGAIGGNWEGQEGAAYLFAAEAGTWRRVAQLRAPGTRSLGRSIALSAGTSWSGRRSRPASSGTRARSTSSTRGALGRLRARC
jgi:hypothetical protein